MLLEVKNLKTQFKLKKGIVNAVNNIDFSIDKGEILAIVGESGSGKSVTSLSIMGLVQDPGKVVDGEILFKGKDLRKRSDKEIQSIFRTFPKLQYPESITAKPFTLPTFLPIKFIIILLFLYKSYISFFIVSLS